MSRRPLVLLAILIGSTVLAACADMTAPRRDDPDPTCRSGYETSSGKWVCTDPPQ